MRDILLWVVCLRSRDAGLAALILFIVFPLDVHSQATHGFCGPVIENVTGNVTINCVSSSSALRDQTITTLDQVSLDLNMLVQSQQKYMFPAMTDFIAHPSVPAWNLVLAEVDLVRRHLSASVESVIAFNSGLTTDPDVETIHSTLFGKESLLTKLPESPPSPDSLTHWIADYRLEMVRQIEAVSHLRATLKATKV